MSEYIERRCVCCGGITRWPRYDATHKTPRCETCRKYCAVNGKHQARIPQ